MFDDLTGHRPFVLATGRNGRRLKVGTAFPATRSRSKYDKTSREHPYPEGHFEESENGPVYQMVSGRRYLFNQRGHRSGGWTTTNRPRLGKKGTKAAKRARQHQRRIAQRRAK